MQVGSLVAQGGIGCKLNLGLILEIHHGCTFTEAKVIWLNSNGDRKNSIAYCAPRFLRVIAS